MNVVDINERTILDGNDQETVGGTDKAPSAINRSESLGTSESANLGLI